VFDVAVLFPNKLPPAPPVFAGLFPKSPPLVPVFDELAFPKRLVFAAGVAVEAPKRLEPVLVPEPKPEVVELLFPNKPPPVLLVVLLPPNKPPPPPIDKFPVGA
jgi:hypothetical protein